MRRLLVVIASGCACGPSGPTSTTTPPPITGRAAPPAQNARLEAPLPSTCRFAGSWEYGQPDALRFRERGQPFATFAVTSTAELQLSPHGAFVELASEELAIRGFVAAGSVRMHAARALAIAGYLVPGPRAALRVVGTNARSVTVEPGIPRYLEPPAPVRAELACKDLTLAVASFDMTAATGKPLSSATFATQLAVPLSTGPGGGAVAQVRLPADVVVDIVETRGAFSRIVIDPGPSPEHDTYVVGWVPSASLQPTNGGHAVSGGFGGGRGAPRDRSPKRRVQCPDRVEFSVEHGGERRVVGSIAPNIEIGIVGETREDFEISLGRHGLKLADGVRAFVARGALQPCVSS